MWLIHLTDGTAKTIRLRALTDLADAIRKRSMLKAEDDTYVVCAHIVRAERIGNV
jgi:hypothetical protein